MATMQVKMKKDMGRVWHNFLKREVKLIEALDKRDKQKNFDRESNWSETNNVGRVWSF